MTTFIYQKEAGVTALLKRGLMVRLGKWGWVTLLIFPVLVGRSLGLGRLLGSPVVECAVVAEAAEMGAPRPVYLLIAFVVIFFNAGPWQEEFGWRGFAFEHLQK